MPWHRGIAHATGSGESELCIFSSYLYAFSYVILTLVAVSGLQHKNTTIVTDSGFWCIFIPDQKRFRADES